MAIALAGCLTDAARSGGSSTAHGHYVAHRLRRLWVGGLIIAWLGALAFSVGLIGYCDTLHAEYTPDDIVTPEVWSPLVCLLPIGFACSLFGAASALMAMAAELLARAQARQVKQVMFVLAVLAVIAVAATLLLEPRLSGTALGTSSDPLRLCLAAELALGDAVRFGVSPRQVGARIGESSLSYGTPLAWLVLLALPCALLVLPWAFFWPAPPSPQQVKAAPSQPHQSAANCVARRLKTLLCIALIVLANAAVCEALWLHIYVARWQANNAAALSFANAALYWAGGAATISVGAVMAALLGLQLSGAWRPGIRSLAGITALCAACLGVIRLGVGDRLHVDDGAVIFTATYSQPPDWVIPVLKAEGMPIETQSRVEVIRPFSLLGPHSFPLLLLPFLALPLVFRWPTTSHQSPSAFSAPVAGISP